MNPRLVVAFSICLLVAPSALGQVSQSTFEFHSGFWLNLHHTLFNQATTTRAGRPPDLSTLTPAEANLWNQAVEYYGRSLISHDLLEASMVRINQALALAGDAPAFQSPALSQNLNQVLAAVAPIYRARLWPEHDAKNKEWIVSITPVIAKSEGALKPALSRAYDTPWPKAAVRVEVSYYVAGNSAFTSTEPTLVTISSRSERNQGAGGLETVFHEAGHALVQKAFAEIAKDEKSLKKELKYRDLWHALLFYTTDQLVKKQVPELEPYAMKYGLWESNWPEMLPIMEKTWKPFLEGKGTFKDAVKQLVADSPSN